MIAITYDYGSAPHACRASIVVAHCPMFGRDARNFVTEQITLNVVTAKAILFPGDQFAVVPGRGEAANPEPSGTRHPAANFELSAGFRTAASRLPE
jgi:membrane-associated protease RseP (regulator of RpoE activity)